MKHRAVCTVVLAGGLSLAGCAAPIGQNSTQSVPAAFSWSGVGDAKTGAPHNGDDTLFAQMMIPHSAWAVRMSDILLAKGGGIDGRVRDAAARIKFAHGPAAGRLEGWLEEWGDPAVTGSAKPPVDALMGQEALPRLRAAEGDRAARIFLSQMVIHHLGAVQMAQAEVDNGSNPEAVDFAGKVMEGRQAEIRVMERLLRLYE